MGHDRRPAPRSAMRVASSDRVVESLRSEGPSSQAALARRTGLSPATVNSIVADLRAEGLAEVKALNGRETVVSLVARQGALIAIEVDHNSVWGSAYRLDVQERIAGQRIDATEPRAVVEMVKRLSRACDTEPAGLGGVSVALQAPIDRRTDTVANWVTNRLPRWRDVPLTKTLSRSLGTAVVVDNDANLSALAEWTWGVGRGIEDFLYVKASGGVGGGLVIDGRIYHGGSGMAGVLGHVVVEPSGEVCYCGNRGCLATLVTQRAILNAVGASRSPRANLAEVIASAEQGDPACRRVLTDAGLYLGRAVANAAKIMGPSMVAIGGIMGTAGAVVLDGVRAALEVRSLRSLAPATRIEAAILDGDASLLGGVAAALAMRGQGLSELPPWMIESPTMP